MAVYSRRPHLISPFSFNLGCSSENSSQRRCQNLPKISSWSLGSWLLRQWSPKSRVCWVCALSSSGLLGHFPSFHWLICKLWRNRLPLSQRSISRLLWGDAYPALHQAEPSTTYHTWKAGDWGNPEPNFNIDNPRTAWRQGRCLYSPWS